MVLVGHSQPDILVSKTYFRLALCPGLFLLCGTKDAKPESNDDYRACAECLNNWACLSTKVATLTLESLDGFTIK